MPAALMAQQKMTVHLKTGEQITYDIRAVDHITLEAPTTADGAKAAEGVMGVVAEPVDMGLSVLWATHNLGASLPTDDGGRYSWQQAITDATAWGSEWRLPTEEEWQELYNKCSWQWEVRDGVGGRLITAENGNTIFIPATGVAFDSNVQIRGCIGIYWTGADVEAAEQVPTSAVGTYFDSANIYRINYPCTNTFSVRLVK